MSAIDPTLTSRAKDLLSPFPEYETLKDLVEVHWNRRMRSSAGRAFWPSGKVDLNPLLQNISEQEIERTLRHELAHILVFARYGTNRQSHGPEWQFFCTQLGIPGELATHRLNFPRRKMRKNFVYKCETCDTQFERVKKIQRASACSHCCRKYNKSRFSRKYLLKEYSIER